MVEVVRRLDALSAEVNKLDHGRSGVLLQHAVTAVLVRWIMDMDATHSVVWHILSEGAQQQGSCEVHDGRLRNARHQCT